MRTSKLLVSPLKSDVKRDIFCCLELLCSHNVNFSISRIVQRVLDDRRYRSSMSLKQIPMTCNQPTFSFAPGIYLLPTVARRNAIYACSPGCAELLCTKMPKPVVSKCRPQESDGSLTKGLPGSSSSPYIKLCARVTDDDLCCAV